MHYFIFCKLRERNSAKEINDLADQQPEPGRTIGPAEITSRAFRGSGSNTKHHIETN